MNPNERALQILEEITEELTDLVIQQPVGELRSTLLDMSERIDDFLIEENVDADVQVVDYDDLDEDPEDEEEAA